MPIVVENLSYTYMKNTASAYTALHDVSFTVGDSEFIGLIGHTGSGKSTLIQQLNGLMHPTNGSVTVDGYDMNDKKQRQNGRALIGMVFQYPDYQLFDSTVLADVSFGPKNMGLSDDEIRRRAIEAIELVGLDPAEMEEKSPFELSGGQKRRAALAGIVAMRPKYLVLDEPMAGLDPGGRRDVLALIDKLRRELGCAVIMVSHSMDDIARSAERIIVLNKGRIKEIGTPDEIFSRAEELAEIGLDVPKPMQLAALLRKRGIDVPDALYTEERFIAWFEEAVKNA
ncbi:MAG: energy-coupling factor transporter ATPase [Clostridium sp.]|nr:energy-coupling factor transporter ATPase [Clostridium sp.]